MCQEMSQAKDGQEQEHDGVYLQPPSVIRAAP